jgi:poly(A) polymerase
MTTLSLTPRPPQRRPLFWTDTVYDLQDALGQFDAEIYLVGGAVRDSLLGVAGKDFDLTTTGDPVRIARHIANTFAGDIYVMDAERGVARAMIDRPDGFYIIDVNAMRGDGLLADLRDRDFTINAIAVDLMGDLTQIIDPLGGESDLINKLLRRCDLNWLVNDPVRSLRAVRMTVKYQLRLDGDTLQDVWKMLAELQEMPAERGRDEFFKILSLNKAHVTVRLMEQLKLLNFILPEVAPLKHIPFEEQSNVWDMTLHTMEKLLQMMVAISPRRTDSNAAVFDLGTMVMALDVFRQRLQAHLAVMWPDERSHEALLLLSILLLRIDQAHEELDLIEMVEERGRALRLSVDEIRRLKLIVAHHHIPLTMATDDLSLHRFWHEYQDAGVDLCLVGMAVYLGQFQFQPNHDEWVLLLEQMRVILYGYYMRYDEIVSPPVLLNGDELMAQLGLKPSKQIGQLLTAIREAQVIGEVQTKDDALIFVRRLL